MLLRHACLPISPLARNSGYHFTESTSMCTRHMLDWSYEHACP